MAEGLNRVMLLGNLGADPELKVTPGGQAVLKLRLATTESLRGQEPGAAGTHRMAPRDRLGQARRGAGEVPPEGRQDLHRGTSSDVELREERREALLDGHRRHERHPGRSWRSDRAVGGVEVAAAAAEAAAAEAAAAASDAVVAALRPQTTPTSRMAARSRPEVAAVRATATTTFRSERRRLAARMRTATAIAPRRCPCGAPLEAAAGDGAPRPGDLAVCLDCALPLRFDDKLYPHHVHLDELAPELRQRVEQLQAQIRAFRTVLPVRPRHDQSDAEGVHQVWSCSAESHASTLHGLRPRAS